MTTATKPIVSSLAAAEAATAQARIAAHRVWDVNNAQASVSTAERNAALLALECAKAAETAAWRALDDAT